MLPAPVGVVVAVVPLEVTAVPDDEWGDDTTPGGKGKPGVGDTMPDGEGTMVPLVFLLSLLLSLSDDAMTASLVVHAFLLTCICPP